MEHTRDKFDALLEALRRAQFLLDEHHIKDDYLAALMVPIKDILPSQLEQVDALIDMIENKQPME